MLDNGQLRYVVDPPAWRGIRLHGSCIIWGIWFLPLSGGLTTNRLAWPPTDVLGLPIVLEDEIQLLPCPRCVVHGGPQCCPLIALREKVLLIHF